MKRCLYAFLLFSILWVNFASAELLLGLGYGMEKLPSNSNTIALITPNGETVGPFSSGMGHFPGYLYVGDKKVNKVSFGFAFSGYTLKKWVSDYSGRADIQWIVIQYSGYLIYRWLLGEDKNINPYLGIRVGASIVPIDVSGQYNLSDTYYSSGRLSGKETNIAPYVGAELLCPFKNSPLNVFVVIDKIFCKYKEDINVGSLSFAVGLTYTFRKKVTN